MHSGWPKVSASHPPVLPQHCRLSMITVAGAHFHPRTSSIVSHLHCYHLYHHCCAFNLVMLPSLLCCQSDDATIVAMLSMPVRVQCATEVAVVSVVSSCSMLLLLLLCFYACHHATCNHCSMLCILGIMQHVVVDMLKKHLPDVFRENAGNRVRKQKALLFWTQQSLAAAFNAFR